MDRVQVAVMLQKLARIISTVLYTFNPNNFYSKLAYVRIGTEEVALHLLPQTLVDIFAKLAQKLSNLDAELQ